MQVLDAILEMLLHELCSMRDDCDDPWAYPRRATCPRGAKIRRPPGRWWRGKEIDRNMTRIIGDDE
jgi:hypothetical protein